jgi:hypothetical protein
MKVRKIVLGAAAVALACASVSVARAADQSTMAAGAGLIAPSSDVSLSPVYLQAAPSGPTSLTPIMYLLDPTSFGKWMEANGFSVTGFVEGGYFYDTSNPRMGASDAPTEIGFPGFYSNRGLLDQADLTIQKSFVSGKTFDWGFQVEGGYGVDDSQIHSYGILDNRAPATIDNKFNPNPDAPDPDNQFDLVQANFSVLLPIGNGLTIKAGKFVTLLGYETISPLGNQFYTHSYLFTFGLPLTQTGVLGSYTFPKLVFGNDWTFTAGVTRGWNESTRDNNGEVDFLGSATGNITDKLGLTFTASEGPESYEIFPGYAGDSGNYWTVLEAIPTYKVSDQLTLAVDMLYADFPHGSFAQSGQSAQWYSVAPYAGYKINSYFTINARGEYYRDQGGFSVGTGVSANYYEGTVGVQIHPFPNDNILQYLQLRPEVRYDYSDKPIYNLAHTGTISPGGDYGEFTVAMDAIMQI